MPISSLSNSNVFYRVYMENYKRLKLLPDLKSIQNQEDMNFSTGKEAAAN